MITSPPRLEIRNLSKTFAGVTVLEEAYLSIAPGEIHALVGQNGSGKSTLIKLISGVYRPDAGAEILLDGEHIGPPVNPKHLHEQGLAFVHQDLGLVPDLTVRENARVGRYSVNKLTRKVNTRKDAAAVRKTLEFLGIDDIHPSMRVSSLPPSARVGVAIARALQDRQPGSGVIVFDESSRAIPRDALPGFYEMIHLLAREGTAVLLVSHDLKEVLQVADRATALRNGRVVEMGVPTAELDEAALTSLVLGRSAALGDIYHDIPTQPTGESVDLRQISGGRVTSVNASIQRGEVVGFIGNVDSGLPDLAPLLGGDRRGAGTITVAGASVDLKKARNIDLLTAGVAYIPQDRHGKGLATELSVTENVTLPHLLTRGHPWWTGAKWQREATEQVIEEFDVRPRGRKTTVATMSGGNQQKVLLGKWLLGDPALVILDDPTQAVDVGARHTVLSASRQAAANGAAVILCTEETADHAAVCDRVLVLNGGEIVQEIRRPFDSETLLAAMFAAEIGDAAAAQSAETPASSQSHHPTDTEQASQ